MRYLTLEVPLAQYLDIRKVRELLLNKVDNADKLYKKMHWTSMICIYEKLSLLDDVHGNIFESVNSNPFRSSTDTTLTII